MDSGHQQLSGTRRSDAAARFSAAVDLLNGPSAAAHAPRAIADIEAASAHGHAAATELCAVLAAVAGPAGWGSAIAKLQLAAEQGSTSAAMQLLLLRDNQRDPQLPEDAAKQDWSAVAAAIRLEERLQCGPAISLSDSPRVSVIRQFATAAECRWLMRRASQRLCPATVFDRQRGSHMHHDVRNNSATELQWTDMDVVTEMVRGRISRAVKVPVPLFEPTQILRYEVGQEFRAHHDFLDPDNPAYHGQLRQLGQRMATFLIYLNQGYSGGETEFPKAGLSFRGEAGDALFFANVDASGRPDRLSLHAGRPPTAGEKWILSQWIRDRAPRPM